MKSGKWNQNLIFLNLTNFGCGTEKASMSNVPNSHPGLFSGTLEQVIFCRLNEPWGKTRCRDIDHIVHAGCDCGFVIKILKT